MQPLFESMTPRQQSLRKELRNVSLFFEGIPGVGKTTMVKALCSYIQRVLRLNSVALLESMRPALFTYFKTNPQQRAAATQYMMLGKRLLSMQHSDAVLKQDSTAVILYDRSLAGDRVFAMMHHVAGNMSEEEMDIYLDESLAALKEMHPLPPRLTIYLRASDATIKRRLVERGDAEEVRFYTEIEPDYLRDLDKVYKTQMTPELLGGGEVLELQWEDDHPCFGLSDAQCERLLCQAFGLLLDPEMTYIGDVAPHILPEKHVEHLRRVLFNDPHSNDGLTINPGSDPIDGGDEWTALAEVYPENHNPLSRSPTREDATTVHEDGNPLSRSQALSLVEEETPPTRVSVRPVREKPVEEFTRGQVVEYKGQLYFYQPNGSACYLFAWYEDMGLTQKAAHAPTKSAVTRPTDSLRVANFSHARLTRPVPQQPRVTVTSTRFD